MAEEMPRRSLVGAIGALLSTGCLDASPDSGSTGPGDGDGTDDSAPDESGESVPERCDVRPRSGWGRGDTAEATVTTGDGTRSQCVSRATDLALEETLRRSDVARYSSPPQWIQSYSTDLDGEQIVELLVRAEKSSDYTGDGSSAVCPPESYSFDELIGVVPEEVVVERQGATSAENSESNRTCTLRVRLKQVRQQLD